MAIEDDINALPSDPILHQDGHVGFHKTIHGGMKYLLAQVQALVGNVNAKYAKPTTGIPKSDLSASLQSSVDKANSALQAAPVTQVAGRTGDVTLTKSDVGLGSAENTPDIDKVMSGPTQLYVDTAIHNLTKVTTLAPGAPLPDNPPLQSGTIIIRTGEPLTVEIAP